MNREKFIPRAGPQMTYIIFALVSPIFLSGSDVSTFCQLSSQSDSSPEHRVPCKER